MATREQKERVFIHVWYAVNRSGQGKVFAAPPKRDPVLNIWVGKTDVSVTMFFLSMSSQSFFLPNITYDDDPVPIKLTIAF